VPLAGEAFPAELLSDGGSIRPSCPEGVTIGSSIPLTDWRIENMTYQRSNPIYPPMYIYPIALGETHEPRQRI